jgi:outer membrane receptor protein involved in Fe transport
MKSHRRLACPHYGRATIFGLLMASCSATAATAQTAAEGDMDDPNTIVVTAQKREQALQDVPIAISAVSAEDLSNRGVTDLQNLSGSVASLSFTGSFGVGGSTSIGIRGVSGQPLPAGVAPTVAVYVDGEYQPSVFSSFFTLDDVERIEVLRGPQGTLYGRNSTGGAINIVTREPGRELKGGIDLTYGNYNHFLGRGSISGPIADGLSMASLPTPSRGTGLAASIPIRFVANWPIVRLTTRSKPSFQPIFPNGTGFRQYSIRCISRSIRQLLPSLATQPPGSSLGMH